MKSKVVILAMVLLIPFGKGIHAETEIQNAEAIFIYNFLSHIQWPEESLGSKYVVGVLGRTPTFNYLVKHTSNRKIGTRTIEVKQYASVNDLTNCQVLLVAYNKSDEINEISQKLSGKSCLIVSQKPNLTESGAVIAFSVINGKLRYKINETNAKEQNLLLSSSLMQMALK